MNPKRHLLQILLVSALVAACGAAEQGNTTEDNDLASESQKTDLSAASQSRSVWADLSKTTFPTLETVTSTLHNDSRKKAYLPGCAAYNTEKLENGQWTDQGPDKICVWEGFVIPLARGKSATADVTVNEAGTYRLRYTVAFGCQEKKPMSQARCQRTTSVLTPSFVVTEQKLCGSRGLAPCEVGTYCDWENADDQPSCGADDRPGVCKQNPQICTMEFMPVCGCDGVTYPSKCTAASAGTDYATLGECEKPEPTDHRPVCRATGSRSEGWYWADTGALIKWASCAQSTEPKCAAIGSRSEGWYADSGLITWDNCRAVVRIAIWGEKCGGSIGFACNEGLYCQGMPAPGIIGGTGTCRDSGSCEAASDCLVEGNEWVHPACVGHATCENKHCGWACDLGQGALEGEMCAGFAGLACAPGLVCKFALGMCQMPDAAGTCIVPPIKTGFMCSPPNPAVDNRVCGCAGNTYVDACHANMLGASILHKGPCN